MLRKVKHGKQRQKDRREEPAPRPAPKAATPPPPPPPPAAPRSKPREPKKPLAPEPPEILSRVFTKDGRTAMVVAQDFVKNTVKLRYMDGAHERIKVSEAELEGWTRK